MQFHLNGFEPGDPEISDPSERYPASGAQGSVPLTAGKEVRLMVPRGSRDKIIARVVYSGPVPAPVQQGQKIGTLKVWRGEFVVLEVPLQAAENVGTGNLSQRALDAATEFMIGLFRAGIQRL